MISAPGHILRLARAGLTLARYDALASPEQIAELPWPARFGHGLARRLGGGKMHLDDGRGERLSAALVKLGPSFIKLGQFLATRPDMIGGEAAVDLAQLQDRLPPFPKSDALAEIERAFNADPDSLFERIDDAVAAASIAQVHRAHTRESDGSGREVAVKVLRPGIEARFERDLQSFLFGARMAERLHAPIRRLRPVDAVETLAHSVRLEMDLRRIRVFGCRRSTGSAPRAAC